jgi:lysophospholipase L1-like esterase
MNVQKSERRLSKSRRAILATTVMLISLASSLMIVEMSLGRFYYSNIEELRQDEFDEELGWRLKPGEYTVKAPQAFFTHHVVINKFGIRGPEIAAAIPGVRRVIVLGDSFTFGQAVDDAALFSTRLEQRLNQATPELKYQVINAGVPGYGTAQELLMLRRLAAAGIVGDVYVLNVFTNDILDNLRLDYASRSLNPVQPGFDLDANGQLHFAHRPQRVLRERSNLIAVQQPPRSMLFALAKTRMQTFAQTQPALVRLARNVGFDIRVGRVPGIISAWYDAQILEKGVPLMKALIAAINDAVKNRRATLLVAMIPSPMQVYIETYAEILRRSFPDDPFVERFLADPMRAQQIVRAMCEELGLPLLDMRDSLVAGGRAYYFPTDGHFTEAGHALFADALQRSIDAEARRTRSSAIGSAVALEP